MTNFSFKASTHQIVSIFILFPCCAVSVCLSINGSYWFTSITFTLSGTFGGDQIGNLAFHDDKQTQPPPHRPMIVAWRLLLQFKSLIQQNKVENDPTLFNEYTLIWVDVAPYYQFFRQGRLLLLLPFEAADLSQRPDLSRVHLGELPGLSTGISSLDIVRERITRIITKVKNL